MKGKSLEKLMKNVFLFSATISILAIILICAFIFMEGIPFIREYGLKNFILGTSWKPSNSPASYGILPMILGSIYLTIGAVIIGVPIGILTATYLAKFASPKM